MGMGEERKKDTKASVGSEIKDCTNTVILRLQRNRTDAKIRAHDNKVGKAQQSKQRHLLDRCTVWRNAIFLNKMMRRIHLNEHNYDISSVSQGNARPGPAGCSALLLRRFAFSR